MTSDGLSQLLILYSWFPLAALIFVFILIGRLYEKFAGERTDFRLFAFPLVIFGLQAVHTTNQTDGDTIGAALAFLSGLSLIVLCIRLYQKMMSHV